MISQLQCQLEKVHPFPNPTARLWQGKIEESLYHAHCRKMTDGCGGMIPIQPVIEIPNGSKVKTKVVTYARKSYPPLFKNIKEKSCATFHRPPFNICF